MSEYDDVMNRLNNTKPMENRDPFLSDGQHSLIVHSLNEYNDQKWGKSYRLVFFVEQSTKHPAGSLACRIFNINKPSEFPTQANDADGLADFVCTLQGIKLGDHFASMKALIVPRHAGGNSEAQPARGCRINATGQPAKQGINPATKRPYSFTKITYQTVPNDAASIQANRAMLDAKYPMHAPQGYVAPQYGGAGGVSSGHYGGAVSAGGVTQPGPQQPQVYQQPAPMQYQMPQQPVQQPPQGYAPQPVPLGGVHTAYGPPQQPAPTQPGTGGFLAMLPQK